MAADAEALEQVRTIGEQYKYGFVTDIESDSTPPGLERGNHPLHFGEEGRAGMAD